MKHQMKIKNLSFTPRLRFGSFSVSVATENGLGVPTRFGTVLILVASAKVKVKGGTTIN